MTKEKEIEEFKKEIEKELEIGINRNNIIPLDWAMDRINPIIDEIFLAGQNSQKEKDLEMIDKMIEDLYKYNQKDGYSTENACRRNILRKIKQKIKGDENVK